MNKKHFRLTQHVQRGFDQSYKTFKIELVGLDGKAYNVCVDDKATKVNDHSFVVNQDFGEIEVRFSK